MKKLTLSILISAFILSEAQIGNTVSAQKLSNVFLYAGQSNADGRVYNSELPSYLKPGYEYLHFTNVTSSSDGKFGNRTFENRKERWAFCDVTNYFIEQALKTDFYAVKCTYGGTAIDTAATYAHLPVWCADASWISRNNAYRGNIDDGKSLTKSLTEGFTDCADVTLSKLNQGYDVKAIMWHQGESDRSKAGNYYKNFKDMINYMRNAVYQITGKDEDKSLPFIFGTISHNSKQYSKAVEEAQKQVAEELANVYYIDMSDAGLRSDALHFDSAWTEYLGKKMYNMLVNKNIIEGEEIEVEKPQVADELDVFVAKYKDYKACAITYTFDDGLVEQYTKAATELERRGFLGTFGINGSRINKDNENITDTTRMTWAQVKQLSERGHEITNHGWAHKNFSRFPIEVIKEDIQKNDSAIFAATGIMPRTFLYPNNNKQAAGRKFVEQNRVGTRLFQRSIGHKSTKENLESWVKKLIETNDWGVGMTHGITFGYDAFPNPQRFCDHLDNVKEQEDKIWVGTLRQVLSYIKERDCVKLYIKSFKKQKLSITPHLALDNTVFIEPLTMVIANRNIKKISVKQDGKKINTRLKDGNAIFDFNPFGGAVEVKYKD